MRTRTKQTTWTIGILLLFLALPAAAVDTWYVRPHDWTHGGGITHTGESYENAFDGFEHMTWASVQLGHTVYVCGQHIRSYTGLPYQIAIVATNGTSDAARVTIRGDYSGDPGYVWGTAMPSSWTAVGDGTYTWTLPANSTSKVIRDIGADNSYTAMTAAASLAACQATENSYWADAYASGHTLYVHMPGEVDPTGHVAVSGTGYMFDLTGRTYLTFRNLSFYKMRRWLEPEDNTSETAPNNITWYGCTIYNCGEYWYNYSHHLKWENCTIQHATAGAIYATEFPSDGTGHGPSYFTIRNCKIHDVRGTSDSHVVGTQGVNNFLIEKNEMYDCGSGLNINLQGATNSPTTNVTIRWNYIHDMHTENSANGEAIKLGALNAASQAAWTGCAIYGNILDTCTYGVNCTWGGVTVLVCNNTAYNCGTSFYQAHNGANVGPAMVLWNNISLSPTTYHVSYNSGAYAPTIDGDYNCFYPSDAANFYINSLGHSGQTKTLAQWQALTDVGCTFDGHSLGDDPLLADPANGEFTLKAESPVKAAGTLSILTGTQYQWLLDPQKVFTRSTLRAGSYLFYGDGTTVPMGAVNYGHQKVLRGFKR